MGLIVLPVTQRRTHGQRTDPARTPYLHRLRIYRFSPFACRFSPYWDHFDNGNIVSESKSQRFFGYQAYESYFARYLRCTRRSRVFPQRIETVRNGTGTVYASGASTASIYSRLCPSYARAYGRFSCVTYLFTTAFYKVGVQCCMTTNEVNAISQL